ncbi:MAG: TetR/AcrR family transcriptional regulator [Clostridia bacterium]|nr:TetR/AcrR family transcriptional regulator [Clostridia bacterium]
MRPINEKLAEELLEAGKREFLERGFQGASMRSIAAAAGVTTGALYRYYTDKAALMDALVKEPAETLENAYREQQRLFAEKPLQNQLDGLPEISDESAAWMMEYIYDHFDAFKLIVCCSVGTKYEHYLDTLIDIESESGRRLIDRMQEEGVSVRDMDDALIHILSSALFNGIFETVRHDMPREEAFTHMESLRDFYSAGWFKILGISGD